jgi:hypothetical protein
MTRFRPDFEALNLTLPYFLSIDLISHQNHCHSCGSGSVSIIRLRQKIGDHRSQRPSNKITHRSHESQSVIPTVHVRLCPKQSGHYRIFDRKPELIVDFLVPEKLSIKATQTVDVLSIVFLGFTKIFSIVRETINRFQFVKMKIFWWTNHLLFIILTLSVHQVLDIAQQCSVNCLLSGIGVEVNIDLGIQTCEWSKSFPFLFKSIETFRPIKIRFRHKLNLQFAFFKVMKFRSYLWNAVNQDDPNATWNLCFITNGWSI